MVEWGDPGGVTGPDRPIAGLHVHHSDDEAWYVLEGTLGFRLGDRDGRGRGRERSSSPAAARRTRFWNARPEPARYVLVMTPRIHRLVQALARPGRERLRGHLPRARLRAPLTPAAARRG